MSPASNSNESPLVALDGEQRLIAAILRQALTDSKSARTEIRGPALDFLADPAAVTFWAELAGLDGQAVLYYVQRHLVHEGMVPTGSEHAHREEDAYAHDTETSAPS